jgi:hypothetical protein
MLVILAIWGSFEEETTQSVGNSASNTPTLVLFNRRGIGPSGIDLGAQHLIIFLFNIAVAANGKEAVFALAKAFESQWINNETQQYWDKRWRRHIVLELYRSGTSLETTLAHLVKVEEEMGIWDDIDERVRDCEEQALAWFEVGEPARAQALLPRMLESSFGIYHDKDYRFHIG